MFAERLIKEHPDIPLKGLAAGNGCWGNKVGLCSDSGDAMTIISQFYQAHNMISDDLWDRLQSTCDWYRVTPVRIFTPRHTCLAQVPPLIAGQSSRAARMLATMGHSLRVTSKDCLLSSMCSQCATDTVSHRCASP